MAAIDIMDVGRQGLTVNQQALQTTSHNIANANTPGYSRQRAILQTNPQSVASGSAHRIGGGVNLKGVIRIHDGFIQSQIRDEVRVLSSSKSRADVMTRLESIIGHEGFRPGEIINRFFADTRDLSANAEAPAMKNALINAAKNAASEFRQLANSIEALSQEVDGRIGANVVEVNALSKELADLNERIRTADGVGNTPLELLDRRDVVLRDLSSKMGFETLYDDQNNANVQTGGLGILVQGSNSTQMSTARTHETDSKLAGSVDVLVQEGKNTRTVTRGVAAGEVGGLIQIRDTVIKPALEELNKIAHAFAQAVNQVHREGISTDGGSGRDLFEVPEDGKGAAQGLYLNREVDGVDKIAVGYSLELPGDNRVALKMSEIQKALIVPAKGYSQNGEEITQAGLTLNDALTNWSGNIASVAQKENQLYSHQKSILEQLDNYHQTISGVNLEEEAIQMMQYQSVFNASAKVMKVGDELLQTILSLKP